MSHALLIVDPTLKSYEGHSYQYDTSVGIAARKYFDLVEIYPDRRFPADIALPMSRGVINSRIPVDVLKKVANKLFSFGGRSSDATRDVAIHASIVPGVWKWIIRLGYRVLAADFRLSLADIIRRFLSRNEVCDVHVFIQHARRLELLAVEQLLKKSILQGFAARVCFHLVLRTGPGSLLAGETKAELADRLVSMSRSNGPYCFFYSDSEELSREYQSMGAGHVSAIPVPIHVDESLLASGACPQRSIGFFGPPRVDKGFCEIPGIIEQLDKSIDAAGMDVCVQIADTSVDPRIQKTMASLVRLRESSTNLRITLLPGPLEPGEYYRRLSCCGIAVFPYVPSKYTVSTSGVFIEALWLGIPVICPSVSWMSNVLDRLETAHGLVPGATFSSVTEIPFLIQRMFGQHSQLKKAAAQAASVMKVEHDPALIAKALYDNSLSCRCSA
ncbi:MAG: hypothetical protein AB1560_00120 [Pseudomonadota bacterium]